MSAINERPVCRHETADRQLAHEQKDEVARVYDWGQFLDERKKMM